MHNATPFGAVASVYAWERIGAVLCCIARRLLHMALFRYVDDFFAPERYVGLGCCMAAALRWCAVLLGRPESLEHGMSCFARLIRALLGHSAVANRKLECGLGLVVLGVEVALSMTGYALRPAKAKALACIELMERALEGGVLSPGCAQKLAGRLSWAGQHLFHRVGRAMLRPIFRQRFARRAGTLPPLTCVWCCGKRMLCWQGWRHRARTAHCFKVVVCHAQG